MCPQIAAGDGTIASQAEPTCPALSDFIIMVENTSFMGLGGPNLVKGATGEVTNQESLGGARHGFITRPAPRGSLRRVKDDQKRLPRDDSRAVPPNAVCSASCRIEKRPSRPAGDLYGVLPPDHRLPYSMEDVLACIFDGDDFTEFQAEFAPEMLCAGARLSGHPVAVIANRRGFLKPRIGGIIYTETARKVAYFVELAERQGTPIIYVQDVSGFMVGLQAESEGIIRAGAEMVETMSCATVPRIVLTINHASGAGYYAMAGQGFDPNFTFSWPSARIGVMEGESAVQALFAGVPPSDELKESMARTRADYERWLDAKYAAARGHCDAVIDPLDTRAILTLALEVAMNRPRALPLILETL